MPGALAPLVASLALAMSLPALAAPSKAAQTAIDALTQRMEKAEADYRGALVRIANADPEGQVQADKAIEDMEEVINACMKQRGCSVSTMLAGYKRLLKLGADDAGGEDAIELEDDHDGHGALVSDVPEAARAAALLTGPRHKFDQMVEYNPAVQEGIRRWLTDMRGALLTSYENYQYMRHLMWPQYERAGLPEALLFGIMAKESNGRVHATSRAGAAGPLQFMYATGRRFGLGNDGTGFDTRYDPRSAAEANVAYLNERLGQLNGSIEMSLAAYNGGEGRAQRVFNASGGRSFWDESVYNQFPPETRDYVPMVIAAAWLFLHPREYGLSFPRARPKPAPLRLEQPASIYQLAICMGNRGVREGYMRALRNLNPRYQADSWLSAGTTLNATTDMVGLYHRWCTQGRRAELARMLVLSDPKRAIVRTGPVTPVRDSEPSLVASGVAGAVRPATPIPVAPKDYTVQGGETLFSIARKFQCNVQELAGANSIAGPRYAIRPGQKLRLAGCKG
ncbi:murein transglycosylase [Lysobacter daejeonensis GH1-9]|uniref:Murein transglycosylase n=1 Tax=Lysobacter daejeonensis GH1-9 TaxID=1385517 RepID=A0A0A0F2J8_9GAMM|nr:murein transglycosylase [Lysobacter daejeonensis GH1-9]